MTRRVLMTFCLGEMHSQRDREIESGREVDSPYNYGVNASI